MTLPFKLKTCSSSFSAIKTVKITCIVNGCLVKHRKSYLIVPVQSVLIIFTSIAGLTDACVKAITIPPYYNHFQTHFHILSDISSGIIHHTAHLPIRMHVRHIFHNCTPELFSSKWWIVFFLPSKSLSGHMTESPAIFWDVLPSHCIPSGLRTLWWNIDHEQGLINGNHNYAL